jgi:hypothetical protein
MNKKVNTLFFILAATLFNLIVMIALMVAFLALLGRLLPASAGTSLALVLMVLLFVLSILGTFVIYRWVLNLLSRRFDLEKYFIPLFKRRKN